MQEASKCPTWDIGTGSSLKEAVIQASPSHDAGFTNKSCGLKQERTLDTPSGFCTT